MVNERKWKCLDGGGEDDLVLKSVCFEKIGILFSAPLFNISQALVAPVSGDLIPFSSLHGRPYITAHTNRHVST